MKEDIKKIVGCGLIGGGVGLCVGSCILLYKVFKGGKDDQTCC